jgi:FkbM family methyltransferase
MRGRARFKKALTYSMCGDSMSARSKLWLLGLLAPVSPNDLRLAWTKRFVPLLYVRPNRLGGLRLAICPSDWSETVIFEELFLSLGYDLNLVQFSPTHVIDCGGHIGMFSLLASNRYPHAKLRVYEPNPANFDRIQVNNRINGLSWECIAGAVSAADGQADLNVVNSHGSSLSESPMPAARSVHVRTYGLGGVIQALAPERLLLKLDVEGEERRMWPGLIPVLPETCAIFFETHHGREGWLLAENLLTKSGFVVRELNERGPFFDGFACRGAASRTT